MGHVTFGSVKSTGSHRGFFTQFNFKPELCKKLIREVFYISFIFFSNFFTSISGFLWTDKFDRVLSGQFIYNLILNLARRGIRTRNFKINLLNRV